VKHGELTGVDLPEVVARHNAAAERLLNEG
jgi:hypothetical protein